MGLNLTYNDGQTPLDEDEKEGMLVKSIVTRGELEEFAIRFKHRLVSIHCFPNGNGRHSRMIADIMIEKIYQLPVFSWGGASLSVDMDIRAQYLKAIRKADKGNFDLLLKFARS
ncbi:MAG: Fic family protein [Sediminibacterium sp.]|nr:Fic family protein [Sediminibacterium sp.]